MGLKNKETGELGRIVAYDDEKDEFTVKTERGVFWYYFSLAELNAEWEDVSEEPKRYWSIDWTCRGIAENKNCGDDIDNFNKSIGNYFETREEAEKAEEKLKAWKRLKDKGFKFNGWTHTPITKSLTGYNLHIKAYSDKLADYMDDLQLLFGGEE